LVTWVGPAPGAGILITFSVRLIHGQIATIGVAGHSIRTASTAPSSAAPGDTETRAEK
jgi:hypothetical protein